MIDKLIQYVKSKTDTYEIYYNKKETLDAEIASDHVSFVADGTMHGVAVRVLVDGKLGFSYTSNLDHYKKCVDTALEVAKVSKPDPYFKGFVGKHKVKTMHADKDVLALGPDWVHNFNEAFLEEVKSVNKDILFSIGMFEKEVHSSRIINSEGVDLSMTSAANVVQGALVLEHKGRLETIEFDAGDIKVLQPVKGKEFAQRLLSLLNKQKMKTQNMQLILDPDALASLYGQSYAFSVSGENIALKKSRFHDKICEQVFDSQLTVTDDATTKGLFCTRPFDKEGIPSRNFAVIEKGIFKQPLYNHYYAGIMKTESTGNAQRSVASLPRIASNNVLIKEGSTKSVIGEVDTGIYVKMMLGTHTMNEAVGDFSVGVLEGYYVEKGEIQFPVKDTMIAGNFFDLMQNVTTIGKERRHSLGISGGCYFPEIMFKKIKVIGD